MIPAIEPVVETIGPAGDFGRTRAPYSLFATVAGGEFLGLLGPNGLGNPAALSILPGLVRSRAGSVWMLGQDRWADPVRTRRDIAVLRPAVAPRRAGSRRHGSVR